MDKILDQIRQITDKIIMAVKPFLQKVRRLNNTKSPSANNLAGTPDGQVDHTGHLTRPLKSNSRKKSRPIHRHGRQRVYRLKGYTTVAKVNRKHQSEQHQRLLRRLLIAIIAILLIVLLFNIYNPFRDLSEWYRIIGIDDLANLAGKTTVDPSSTTSTATTILTTDTGTTSEIQTTQSK